MGTNFFLTTPAGPVHLGKRSAGWRFTFNAATVFDTEVRSRKEWERLAEMVNGTVTDEFGDTLTPADFWVHVDVTARGRSFVEALAADDDWFGRRLVERGDVWTDADGWDFHRGEWC